MSTQHTKDEKISQILNTAIQMETEGIEFYHNLSKKASHPFGKKMFLSFAEDEKLHLAVLKDIARELEIPDIDDVFKKGTPEERGRTIFQEGRKDRKEKISAHPDEIQALEIAMEMEREGYELYKGRAEKTLDSKERALFQRLALEENEHFKILQNTHSYLKNPREWFLWEEKAIIDGGIV